MKLCIVEGDLLDQDVDVITREQHNPARSFTPGLGTIIVVVCR